MTERHEPHPTPTLEERAAYRVARYRRPAIWRATDWRCACAPGARRAVHAEPWQCITDEQLAAWLRAHAEVITAPKTARALMWLDRQFARR